MKRLVSSSSADLGRLQSSAKTGRLQRVARRAALPLVLVPAASATPAAAQSMSGVGELLSSVAPWALLAVCAGAVIAEGLAWRRQRQRASELASEAADLRVALAAREDALNVAPGAHAGWTANGDWIAGPELANVVGLFLEEEAPTYGVLLRLTAEADRERLAQAVDRLRQEHVGFSLTLRVNGKTCEITGSPAPAGGTLASVLWVHDVDQREQERARQSAGMAAAEGQARLFAEMFDALDQPVWLRRADGVLLACNKAYARAVEAETPDIAIAAQRELVGARVEWIRELSASAASTNKAHSGLLHVVIGGARRLLEITETPIGGGHLAGFALDRTSAEESQSELARHMAAHEDVLEKLGTAIIIYGPDQRILFANSAFTRLWGLEEGWIAAAPTHGALLEELRARRRLPEQADFQAYKKERLSLYTSLIDTREELVYLPDERVLRMVIYPHPLGGLLYTVEDVTDRLTLERSYNTLIAVQRETLDNLHAAVAVFGADGRLKLHNQAFARMWRMSPAFLAGEPRVVDIVEAAKDQFPHAEGEWEDYKRLLASRATDHVARSGAFRRADGSVLDYNSVPLPDGATMFSYLDVTDSANVERALRERNEALEAADHLKSEFITNVSYELRTPLNTIIGFTEILANQYFGAMNERQTEYSRGILESSRQLLALIDDILDLALIEAGRLSLDLKPVNIHSVLFSVFTLARDRARKQGVALTLDCPATIGVVMADERRLRQALFNLVSNSLKYMAGEGEIVLGARWDEGELLLSVSDSGAGIAPEDQARVFEKFERGGNANRASGLGIGLSLVKSFIELHGGRIELVSAPGQGTVVTCHLPAQPVPQMIQPAGASEPAAE
ncbi:MAG TPA: ATP-binding protein [Alphaproteobacteria bacterium]|nr:ATP-binding protein [Alphaproteobacteria bacterium]